MTFPIVSRDADVVYNLGQVKRRIVAACTKAGRRADEVSLLLVTKTVAPDRICVAAEAGVTLIGENKVQELVAKADALNGLTCERHFIGHLQSNKIKQVLGLVSCIQSLDSVALAEKLDRRLQQEGRAIDVFVQVNTSAESSKFGIEPSGALDLARKSARFGTLRIRGLMTIGVFNTTGQMTRQCFAQLRSLREVISAEGIPDVDLVHLSMGMSLDLEEAIAEGSTMVRVVRSIFGARPSMVDYYWNEADRGG